jgi:Fe-S-cluster containining protein
MPPPTPALEPELWRQWSDAALWPAVKGELRDLYDRLAADIAARSPQCWVSGKCCKFDSYGHLLYVTGLEIAWLLRQLPAESRQRLDDADLPGLDGCPFQVTGMCSVHAVRPLGCRIYYCDPNAQSWQNPVYEQFLTELRDLHERHGLEYRYMEWRAGLADARRIILPP